MHTSIITILVLLLLLYVAPYLIAGDVSIPVHWYKQSSSMFPAVGATTIRLGDSYVMFVAGGDNQPDVLLSATSPVEVIEEFYKQDGDKTYSATTGDMSCNGLDDIIVGRLSGIYVYYQQRSMINGTFFTVRKIHTNYPHAVPMAITAADYNKSGKLSLYIANYIEWDMLEPFTFGTSRYMPNLLLRQTKTADFVDDTATLKVLGDRNSWDAKFIDLNHSGFPDLVVANDEGYVDIYKNDFGSFKKLQFINMNQGAWMGIAVNYFNDYPSMFFTNMGSSMSAVRMMKHPKLPENFTASHMWLFNNGRYNLTEVFRPELQGGIAWRAAAFDFTLNGTNDLVVSENFHMLPHHRIPFLRGIGGVYIHVGKSYYRNQPIYVKKFKWINRNYSYKPIPIDLTGDGRLDILWYNFSGRPVAYKNTSKRDFLNIIFKNTATHINAIAKLTYRHGKKIYTSTVQHLSGDGMHQFGLGTFKDDSILIKLEIQYHDTKKKTLYNLTPNTTIYA